MMMSLNQRALGVVETLLAGTGQERRVAVHSIDGGGRYIDCGIAARGGLITGVELARVCLGDLAQVAIVPGEVGGRATAVIQVVTDHPVHACLASQYAGWALKDGKYFAMGSGPMRAAAGTEAIYDVIDSREPADAVVGVLEARKPPTPAIVAKIASACRVEPANVTLLVAPTASLAGGVQIVARSVETALHKLAELKFDLSRIVAAHGTAPLPPVAANDLAAIGRTNDAILYGARVVLGGDRRRPQPGIDRPSGAVIILARLRRAVRGDLRAVQQRFLRGRPSPVQPRRGGFPQHRDGRDACLRRHQSPRSWRGRSPLDCIAVFTLWNLRS